MSEITVIVPSYNHAPFVERTLRSVFAQTVKPKKLIVIDDGSKDESLKIIKRVLPDCPFEFEFIFRENRGLSKTLNQGLSLASGKFFAYISSDDVWLPTFLESRAKILENRPNAVLAYGYSYLIDEQDAIFDSTKNWSEYADGNALSMLLRPTIPASASVLYRRRVLEKYFWNENSILEDYELYLRLSASGEFALDENILSAWRIHSYNTSADFPLMVNEWLDAQNRVADEIGLRNDELRQIQKNLKFNCISSYIRYGHKREAAKLIWENSGTASLTSTGKLIFRLLVPTGLLRRRREFIKRQTIKKYGTLHY